MGRGGQTCTWALLLIQADPADPSRVFAAGGCYAGRTVGASLDSSSDFGASWSQVADPFAGFPSRMAGGSVVMPGRFYLLSRPGGGPGHWLRRTDDGGATWRDVSVRGARNAGRARLRVRSNISRSSLCGVQRLRSAVLHDGPQNEHERRLDLD